MTPKTKLRSYRIWCAMKARCYAPSQNKGYYKAFGVKVCERWLHSYETFIADMGGEPDFEDFSIERLDPRGDYEPANCIWIPAREQPKNRTTSKFYTYQGKTLCLKDWAREIGMKYDTLRSRVIRRGMPFEKAISIPTNAPEMKTRKGINHK